MEKITTAQLSKVHTMLNQMSLIDEKANIVYSFSGGRTTSSKELSKQEGVSLIQWLSASDPNERMRKKVFALAYESGIIWGDTPEDKKMNAVKLNQFLLHSGTVKKELYKMTYTELVKVVSQFQQIVKHSGESKANKATKQLLQELNIPTEPTRRKHTI